MDFLLKKLDRKDPFGLVFDSSGGGAVYFCLVSVDMLLFAVLSCVLSC